VHHLHVFDRERLSQLVADHAPLDAGASAINIVQKNGGPSGFSHSYLSCWCIFGVTKNHHVILPCGRPSATQFQRSSLSWSSSETLSLSGQTCPRCLSEWEWADCSLRCCWLCRSLSGLSPWKRNR